VCLCLVVDLPLIAQGQQPEPTKGAPPAAKSATAKPGAVTAGAADESDKTATAPDITAPANPADPSQTRKIAPNEVFRDQKAEALVDLAKLKTAPAKPIAQADLFEFNAQAGGVNATIDKDLISRVIDAMVAKLTDRANVQALIDPPPSLAPTAPAFHGVQEATTALLEPIFQAKSVKNQAFLNTYCRLLKEKLTPQLKNHLIPRVQAMIILGEAGIADYLPLYEAQIKDANQTLWVKLWALEGMVNVVEEGGRLTAQDQIVAAETVANFLDKTDDIPWPVQLRAMEALTAMRQGFQPNRPQKALMANAAMTLLADGNARVEVRSEAARALGLMQISSAVSKYNYSLVAHSAGQLAAELGNRIATGFSANPEKAKYWTALLIGPVYQAFDGTPGARDSGLIHTTTGPSATYVQNVFEHVKPVVRSVIDLLSAGQRQIKDKQKEVLSRVTALKDFLDQNAPADRHLVPDGAEFPIALLPDQGIEPAGAAAAGKRKGQ
jgi:hypothetical protein